jgi:ssDNA-binding Zn-finger/Zn-ribbon topoisomerase 1
VVDDKRNIENLQKEIVKLNKRVDEQQADIDTLIIMDKASRLEIETLKEGEDCPDCGNQGGWKYSATPCRWCHGNPNSKFNRARWKK